MAFRYSLYHVTRARIHLRHDRIASLKLQQYNAVQSSRSVYTTVSFTHNMLLTDYDVYRMSRAQYE